jgi:hypothetical protein
MPVHFNQKKLAQIKMRIKDLEAEIATAKLKREYVRANELQYEYRRLADLIGEPLKY